MWVVTCEGTDIITEQIKIWGQVQAVSHGLLGVVAQILFTPALAGFSVEEVALRQVCFCVVQFSPVITIPLRHFIH